MIQIPSSVVKRERTHRPQIAAHPRRTRVARSRWCDARDDAMTYSNRELAWPGMQQDRSRSHRRPWTSASDVSSNHYDIIQTLRDLGHENLVCALLCLMSLYSDPHISTGTGIVRP